MQQALVEQSVSVAEEPPISVGEDPLLREQVLPVLHACTSDCARCVVAKEIATPAPVTQHGARRRQAEFNAGAFGCVGPTDKYTRNLYEKEVSFNTLKKNVEGCSRITNGTRLRMENMLRNAEWVLGQELEMERAMYVDERVLERTVPRTDEEVNALLYATAMTPEESLTLLERLRSLFGSESA